MSNPDIFGPVGTKWVIDRNAGTSMAGHFVTIELRKDDETKRVYKVTDAHGFLSRENANKGLCIGGPYDGKAMTETDLRIVGLRYDYLGFSRSDSQFDNPLAAISTLGRVWLHKTWGGEKV